MLSSLQARKNQILKGHFFFLRVVLQLNPHPTEVSLHAPTSFGLVEASELDLTFPLLGGRFLQLHLDPFC